MHRLTFGLACCLAAGAAAAQTPAGTVDAFHAALAAGDSAAAIALLDPDVLIFENGRAERSRDEYAGHHLGADMGFASATTRTVTRRQERVLGGETVVVIMNDVHTTGTFRDRDIDSRSVETVVLRRTPAGWRITHIHWSARRG